MNEKDKQPDIASQIKWETFKAAWVRRMESMELRRPIVTPTGIELEVCRDIAERQAKGIAKYGTTVADNPLDLKAWLQHAYQETLDKAVYLKRAIREMEKQ